MYCCTTRRNNCRQSLEYVQLLLAFDDMHTQCPKIRSDIPSISGEHKVLYQGLQSEWFKCSQWNDRTGELS